MIDTRRDFEPPVPMFEPAVKGLLMRCPPDVEKAIRDAVELHTGLTVISVRVSRTTRVAAADIVLEGNIHHSFSTACASPPHR